MNLSPQSVVVASSDQLASQIAGETVILGISAGRYYGVADVGTRIWQLIQKPVKVSEVLDAIVAEYEVEPGVCETDLRGFLLQMIDAGLVEVCSEPSR